MPKIKPGSLLNKIKELHGDPHYVSLGIAIGVFVAITPTIPFHTVTAVALAVFFKASKPAAIIGVWVSNPFTVFFLYFACYKTGHIFFEDSIKGMEAIRILLEHLESDIDFSSKFEYFKEFMHTNIKIFMIMNIGGVILGLPSGIISYFAVKQFFTRLKLKKALKKESM